MPFSSCSHASSDLTPGNARISAGTSLVVVVVVVSVVVVRVAEVAVVVVAVVVVLDSPAAAVAAFAISREASTKEGAGAQRTSMVVRPVAAAADVLGPNPQNMPRCSQHQAFFLGGPFLLPLQQVRPAVEV